MFYDLLVPVVLIFALLFLSGLASASEVAFFSLPTSTVKNFSKSKSRAKKLVAKLLEQPQKLLLTILIANNFINVGIALVGTIIALRVSPMLEVESEYAISVSVILITVLVIVFGEILPKVISSKNPELVSTLLSGFVNIASIIFYPLTELFLILTNAFKKRIPKPESNILVEEIEPLIELGGKYGVIHDEEKKNYKKPSSISRENGQRCDDIQS
jgi:putative hemolysin